MKSYGITKTRSALAISIIVLSIAGIAIISSAALWLATEAGRSDMARLVFTSILPLLGTWVGTVLAFYFARENLTAATASTAALVGLQPDTPVTQVMIPKSRMTTEQAPPNTEPGDLLLSALYQKMSSSNVSRLPILDSSGAVRYVIQQSTIGAFASSLESPTSPASLNENVNALAADPKLGQTIRAIGFVDAQAVVGDARKLMRSIPHCHDIFVTQSGLATDPVIGWLTNTDLASVA